MLYLNPLANISKSLYNTGIGEYLARMFMHNFGLFDRYLNKVKAATIDKFGSLSVLQAFLHHLAEQGNVLLALRNQDFP